MTKDYIRNVCVNPRRRVVTQFFRRVLRPLSVLKLRSNESPLPVLLLIALAVLVTTIVTAVAWFSVFQGIEGEVTIRENVARGFARLQYLRQDQRAFAHESLHSDPLVMHSEEDDPGNLYLNELFTLQAAIGISNQSGQLLRAAGKENLWLSKTEHAAIKAVRHQQLAAAIQLLNSEQYAKHVKLHKRLVDEAQKALYKQHRRQAGYQKTREIHAMSVTALYQLLVTGGLFAGIVFTRRWLRASRISDNRLRDSDRRRQAILDSAGDAIVGLDDDTRILFSNRAAADYVGTLDTRLNLHDVLHNSGQCDQSCGLLHLLKSNRPSSGESVVQLADGRCFPAEIKVVPSQDEDVSRVIVFRDISQQYESERIKDEFLSIVSHELRTPLTSMRASFGLLAGGVGGPLNEQGMKLARIGSANSDRLSRLVNDLLRVDRDQMTRAEFELQPIDDIIHEAVDAIRSMAAEAGVRIDVDSATSSGVLCDRDRLVQVISNLLNNAVKFSVKGSHCLVSATTTDNWLEVSVSDSGRGIPSDMLSHIFERFVQVDSSDKRNFEGTGLGLAISRQIIEQHGGSIWAESTPGSGSTLRFRIPTAFNDVSNPQEFITINKPAKTG